MSGQKIGTGVKVRGSGAELEALVETAKESGFGASSITEPPGAKNSTLRVVTILKKSGGDVDAVAKFLAKHGVTVK